MNDLAQRRRPSLTPHLSLAPLSILAVALGMLFLVAALVLQPVTSGTPVPRAAVESAPAPPIPAVNTAAPSTAQEESQTQTLAVRQMTLPGGARFEAALVRKTPPAAKLTAFDEALLETLVKNWVPPSGPVTMPVPLEAVMDVVIKRGGTLETYSLVHASGQSQLDMSVLRAAGLAKQISSAWPAEFSGDRCEVQIHFRALSK